MRKSRVLEKLRAGQSVFSTQILSGSEMLAGAAAQVGADCLWLDTEHTAMTEHQTIECIRAAQIFDTDCVVRIRKSEYYSYFRPLEDGAAGIMVPHCMGPDDARLAVRNGKFPPLGLRGQGGAGACYDFYGTVGHEADMMQNDRTFIMLQIEDKEALDQIDEILDVEGFELVFVGPTDLAQSLAKFGDRRAEALGEAIEKIALAFRKHPEKWWGLPCAPDNLKKYYDMGARFFNLGCDFINERVSVQKSFDTFHRILV